jgi:hypothetical protein
LQRTYGRTWGPMIGGKGKNIIRSVMALLQWPLKELSTSAPSVHLCQLWFVLFPASDTTSSVTVHTSDSNPNLTSSIDLKTRVKIYHIN